MDRPTDYTTWTHADLIQRVTALEAQLRARNDQHRAVPSSSLSSPATSSAPQKTTKKERRPPKKPAKGFDPSRYHARLIALKFAYLGAEYGGFEHHSNNPTARPTVEEALWRALRKTKLIFPVFRPGQREGERSSGKEEVCWDGIEYSKCGRTDRGVSAFGQVVGLRVRSGRPKEEDEDEDDGDDEGVETGVAGDEGEGVPEAGTAASGEGLPTAAAGAAEGNHANGGSGGGGSERRRSERLGRVASGFDPIRDELPYIQILNRVLPPDIRVLAWCPDPPADFSARFHCKERRYRYFFTNPAYVPPPGSEGNGGGGSGARMDGDETCGDGGPWLDIAAMRVAAAKYEGLHDFRNLCKIDASKQITNFERRIFHAGIHEVDPGHHRLDESAAAGPAGLASTTAPKLYYFEVRGSAFLWHQVRHLVAILFLVGQRYERPSVVDELLDVTTNPARPVYSMASDIPLVLWDCIFPSPQSADNADHGRGPPPAVRGYSDSLNWVYVGDDAGSRLPPKRATDDADNGKYGRGGVMESLWELWRKRKMHEVLAWNLMNVVSGQGDSASPAGALSRPPPKDASARVFEGGELPRTIGKYVPIMQRERMEPPEVINARYAARKDLNGQPGPEDVADTGKQ